MTSLGIAICVWTRTGYDSTKMLSFLQDGSDSLGALNGGLWRLRGQFQADDLQQDRGPLRHHGSGRFLHDGHILRGNCNRIQETAKMERSTIVHHFGPLSKRCCMDGGSSFFSILLSKIKIPAHITPIHGIRTYVCMSEYARKRI